MKVPYLNVELIAGEKGSGLFEGVDECSTDEGRGGCVHFELICIVEGNDTLLATGAKG